MTAHGSTVVCGCFIYLREANQRIFAAFYRHEASVNRLKGVFYCTPVSGYDFFLKNLDKRFIKHNSMEDMYEKFVNFREKFTYTSHNSFYFKKSDNDHFKFKGILEKIPEIPSFIDYCFSIFYIIIRILADLIYSMMSVFL